MVCLPLLHVSSLLLLLSHSVVSDSLWPHELQHTSLPCPSQSPGACSDSCPLSRWYHPTISSSVTLFSCLQSFQHQDLFQWVCFSHQVAKALDGTSASGSVLPMNIQDWFPLGLTGLISLQFKGLSRIFSQHHILKASILKRKKKSINSFGISSGLSALL